MSQHIVETGTLELMYYQGKAQHWEYKFELFEHKKKKMSEFLLLLVVQWHGIVHRHLLLI